MAANLATHTPIGSVETSTGLTPYTKSLPEQAGQTFKSGVPVQLNGGYVRQWDGTTIAAGIAGFSLIPGSNLATNGAGAPGPFSQVGPPAAIATYGTVPFQPGAVNIAVGTPITDGRTLYEGGNGATIFEGQFDNSNYTNAASITPTEAMIGTQFGLTVDANGMFYVDNNKTTPGTNTVVTMVGINPIDLATATTGIPNARVRFTVLGTALQLNG
jgi:hypothetical protein